MLDRDEIVKTNDRRLKIRALQEFQSESVSVRQLEREFALIALELLRCQPAMAEAAGVEPETPPKVKPRRRGWPAASLDQAQDC